MLTVYRKPLIRPRSYSFPFDLKKPKFSDELFKAVNESGTSDIMDIEELVSWCEDAPFVLPKDTKDSKKDCSQPSSQLPICGYNLSRGMVDTVEILLMPYNYILDTKIRRRNSFEFRSKIIILDEAHNVEQVCKESSSHYLSLQKIEAAKNELEKSKWSVGKKKDGGSAGMFSVAEVVRITRGTIALTFLRL